MVFSLLLLSLLYTINVPSNALGTGGSSNIYLQNDLFLTHFLCIFCGCFSFSITLLCTDYYCFNYSGQTRETDRPTVYIFNSTLVTLVMCITYVFFLLIKLQRMAS